MVNYKHLRYFWVVAREGGVARASERLHLTPQTISGQLTLLEQQLGVDLFSRVQSVASICFKYSSICFSTRSIWN
ncbi:MAG: LysR family transcriptional regulator [Gammaproteobacteria bacterium]|jgi:LysR family transcriptional activator of nhaA|nr:LysR family transcriptional regulator [Gammaproteobacteria bacterium]MBT7081959.1 LysR family transcriptional regulator [Chloroflexota bacterium]MBT4195407.1 LysR family transcriptional regulator [Gammaproteobacteria bacterium]MBT4862189.1 LysR family transcriptional regulator [Gammaproteobacteria bacterium]MBT6455244.1 LysR family transcriptional regulator [Gammaproteobacteria bacterium]